MDRLTLLALDINKTTTSLHQNRFFYFECLRNDLVIVLLSLASAILRSLQKTQLLKFDKMTRYRAWSWCNLCVQNIIFSDLAMQWSMSDVEYLSWVLMKCWLLIWLVGTLMLGCNDQSDVEYLSWVLMKRWLVSLLVGAPILRRNDQCQTSNNQNKQFNVQQWIIFVSNAY